MIIHEAPKVMLRWVVYPSGNRDLQMGHWAEDTDTGRKFLVWEFLSEISAETANV